MEGIEGSIIILPRNGGLTIGIDAEDYASVGLSNLLAEELLASLAKALAVGTGSFVIPGHDGAIEIYGLDGRVFALSIYWNDEEVLLQLLPDQAQELFSALKKFVPVPPATSIRLPAL